MPGLFTQFLYLSFRTSVDKDTFTFHSQPSHCFFPEPPLPFIFYNYECLFKTKRFSCNIVISFLELFIWHAAVLKKTGIILLLCWYQLVHVHDYLKPVLIVVKTSRPPAKWLIMDIIYIHLNLQFIWCIVQLAMNHWLQLLNSIRHWIWLQGLDREKMHLLLKHVPRGWWNSLKMVVIMEI